MIQSIAVYCGSSSGYDADFMRLGFQLGNFLARQNIQVIYGGARVGLMGALADGALEAGGKVIGVMPRFLDYKELVQRDKLNLDIFWLKDEALEESANLPPPDVIAADIAADLEAALEQFATIAGDLK